MKSIKLMYTKGLYQKEIMYKVVTTKNTIDYPPGDYLTTNEVERLCDDRRWDVTIVGKAKAA